jgi:hypothetical protein
MINKTKYGIVARGVLTASGHDELHAAFIKKKDAETVLRLFVPGAHDRRLFYKIVKFEGFDPETGRWSGQVLDKCSTPGEGTPMTNT